MRLRMLKLSLGKGRQVSAPVLVLHPIVVVTNSLLILENWLDHVYVQGLMVGWNTVIKGISQCIFPCQELEVAQEAFVHLLGQLKPECKLQFLAWVQLQYSSSTNADSSTDEVNEISEGEGRLGHNDKINI